MSDVDVESAARAVIHVYEMVQVGGGIEDEEFRYSCAEEVETLGTPDAQKIAAEMRRQIDLMIGDTC